MSIFRVEKKENYVVLDKGFLNDKRLSWQAKGLLAYMLSMPNDWVFRIDDLKKRSANGRDSTKNIIKELQEHGYIIKEQTREQGKFSNNQYIVLERPVSPLTENPSTDNPLTEKPSTENPSLLNNKELNNNLLSNKENNVVVVNAHRFYQENFGVESPFVSECIDQWIDDVGDEIVIEAMKRALKQQKKWNYAEGILREWVQNNLRTIEDIEAYEREFHRKREGVNDREVRKHRRGVSRSSKEGGKSYEQALREAEEARRAWGWKG
ncbi:DnaD/phage-associated family protein [Anoxybacillus tengchongensis]|uniref:DnaD/phage-associated family protein n=1 Tax=Anoxybacillus tengchongensis TaxID=576944 RepID=A0A7X0D9F5_9BACL|nr:DnaD domain protein [Anoxybacillus tengchongensis]MBB6176405.1 DnaD/phage-associated family protein [Anoxybacillus tengchongensis]